MFESVIVGWDGRAAGEEALSWVLRHPIGYRYRLTHVVDDRAIAADASRMSSEARAERHLQARVAEVRRSHPAIRIAGEVVVGDPMEELEHRTGPGTLLVLGSDRAPDAIARSTSNAASRVAARARGPVAMIPGGSRDRAGSVLVGVDGTESARAAALRAGELATTIRARLVVLHAWQARGEPEDRFEPADHVGPDAEEDVPSHALQHAHGGLLASVLDDVHAAYPGLALESLLLHESAPRAVLAAAEQAAVVVLGRHSRWSATAALLGSVTLAALLASPAPVLVVGRHDAPLRMDMEHVPEAAVRSAPRTGVG